MNIVLGVSGSVAAYRAADLARELMRQGFSVRVCLTDSAQNFVTPALFEALTGHPCLQSVFEEPVVGRMAHIDWAREADVVVIAPATANLINKLAAGVGDDMLTTIALATTKPLIVAPAMNPQMYANATTQHALATLRSKGAFVVEPTEGDVACGEHGQGKLASIEAIATATKAVVGRAQRLAGKRVLITSGPTQEPIDQVRFISNRSSGKMGAALARAAGLLGAEVIVVTGPTHVPMPIQATVVPVKTALEMHEVVLRMAEKVDLMIGAAAVADYRVAEPAEGKLRRSGQNLQLELVPNPDIIADFAKAATGARVVGFAAEPNDNLEVAREKIQSKNLFAIAVNDVSAPGIGFDSDRNAITLINRDGSTSTTEVMSKLECAIWLLEQVSVDL